MCKGIALIRGSILSVLTVCAVLFIFAACTAVEVYEEESNRFVPTGDEYDINGEDFYVVYDSKTNIVYVIGNGEAGTGLSVLYNNDRLPMTIDEYELQIEREVN